MSKTSDEAAQAAEAVEETAQAAVAGTKDGVQAAKETVQAAVDEATRRTKPMVESLAHCVSENPIISVLVSVGIGYLIGRIGVARHLIGRHII